MGRQTRVNVTMQNRRRQVAELYLRGKTQTEIALEVDMTVATISRDLKAIRQEWRASTLLDFDEAKNRELAKIDALEQTYWQAWYRSIGSHTSVKVEYGGFAPAEGEPHLEGSSEIRQTVKRTENTERLNGDPRYLSGVQDCITQRCKILGIYEATKISLDWRRAAEEQGHNAGELFERMVNAYIVAVDGATD